MYIVGIYIDEYCVWAQVAVFTHVMSYDVNWDRLGTSGRAPYTRETPPDFREYCQVNRYSRVFCGLTGCQQTPGFYGITTWYQSLGIRIPKELRFRYPSPLGVVRCRVKYVGT